ncbi:MAG: hypothetical protein JOZ51_18685 [Chloroflexi bacterium]|nr:hypothetical protein [Chloroflexota bacterium]
MIRPRFRRRSPVTMFLLVLALGAFAVSAVWQARPAYALYQKFACGPLPIYQQPDYSAPVIGYLQQGDTFAAQAPSGDFTYGKAFGVWAWAPTEGLCDRW